MEHCNRPTSSITMINSRSNNNPHHHNRWTQRVAKQHQPQRLPSPSLAFKNQYIPSLFINESRSNEHQININQREQESIPMKHPLAWTKKWTKWFSSCGSDRISHHNSLNPRTVSDRKRARAKSENDVSKRGSSDQDEKKKLSETNSSFALGQNSNENPERRLSRAASHQQHHHHQSNEKVNNSNPVLYRTSSRRYSNPFFTAARSSAPRTSLAIIPNPAAITTTNTSQRKSSIHLSRSVDRLHSKSHHRELRYEEHDDYIPPPPLQSIQCHPTIDHYKKSLNPSTYFSSNNRRSQIETYQQSSINDSLILKRPYSTNIPLSYSIPIISKTAMDNNHAYGKLSECHSPLIPLENSSIKTPRRIESAYGQFPVQEPIYANTQSLYDNILYPQATTTTVLNKNSEREKKSCASQTQLTWTMATFSSFVDLENQSVIIPQPDPNTVYSIVQHYHSEPSPSASPETIQHMKRMSPGLHYIDEPNPSSYYQRPRSPLPSNIQVEKRDGSFQTLLTIAPTEDIAANKQLLIHDSASPTISTGSLTAAGQQPHPSHHHHHHHRKHKSRSNTSNRHISTRDVGLQVNIQTVKKITFSSNKSDESSSTTGSLLQAPTRIQPELKNVETNTEPTPTKHDTGTLYEPDVHLVTSSSSQTFDPVTTALAVDRQTKAAQTQIKTLRDQSIETNNRGLFVCDLSALLTNGLDESSDLSNTTRKA